jgi:hypothetical protein
MFNDQWYNKLPRDKHGYIFLDFNPHLFQHLIEQLRLIENNDELVTLYPPSSLSLVIPFEKMLRKLGINQIEKLKNVIELNVGGEVLTTGEKIFTQISNLTTNQFVDSNPKLFRQWINQLRKEQEIDIETITTEENETLNITSTSPSPDRKYKKK